MILLPYKYIAVQGPVGVGKTHLVKRLVEDFSAKTVLEEPEPNPSALPTQLSFLIQRIKLCKQLQQDGYV